jgi:hypothetical protein
MWDNRYITGVMRTAMVVPVAVANVALAAPVVAIDIDYHDGPQFSHHFNAGTASAMSRPPTGYWYEQPLPKVSYRMISFVGEPTAAPTAAHPTQTQA